MINDRTSTKPRNMSLRAYRVMKLNMLERDFCITLTADEVDRLYKLKTEIQIDQFCIGIINNRWN